MAHVKEHHGTGINGPASEFAARILQAFLECNDEVRKIVLEMVDIMTLPEADADERDAAALTLQEALFPEGDFGDPGVDLTSEPVVPREHRHFIDKMEAQEHTFAECLASLMKRKGIDQSELARRAGVGQPAISMMLSRKCRPQQRTIAKLAEALGVDSKELWPES